MKNPQFILPNQIRKNIPADKNPQLNYIADFFKKSMVFKKSDDKLAFALPYPYIVPDHSHFKEFFYWDTFYIFLGLLVYKDTKELCRGILKNFAYELKRFGRIPNSNTYFSLSRSQSPYFAIAIREYLKVYPEDIYQDWLMESVELAIKEYKEYWMAADKRYADHLTATGLSRYWDINCDSDLFAEYESGWDTSSRLHGFTMELNPIDLNSQLYAYEDFFKWYFKQKNNLKESKKWELRMKNRQKLVNKYCWDVKEKIYFDYNFIKGKKSKLITAAAFFPFYVKLADPGTAGKSLIKLLKILEKEGGITVTDKVSRKSSQVNQWDYPHGWAPINYICYMALMNYGLIEEAKRIKEKWLKTCDYWFNKDNYFYEKYNVNRIGDKVICLTPSRPGFGWTNGVYLKLLSES